MSCKIFEKGNYSMSTKLFLLNVADVIYLLLLTISNTTFEWFQYYCHISISLLNRPPWPHSRLIIGWWSSDP